ncbi:MAG TPA: methyltransferase domain-containing protein, partial [Sphingopyxis sp.]|nr:methyltransferase domain-containing protein [Sphingopyxis sp.]
GSGIAGDGGFDLIVAATSFHWLDSTSALAHVRRLLKAGGAFAMWWNVFQEPGEDALFDALFEGLARPPSLLTGQHYSLDATARCAELAAAGLLDVDHILLSSSIATTPASLRLLSSTFSAIRNLPPEQREARLDVVEEMARRERGERFDRILRTLLYMARSPA